MKLPSVVLQMGRPPFMPDWQKDYDAGRKVLEINGLPVFEAPLHLEGGSIHSDGEGTLMVTEECLLDPSRNPHLDRAGIEKVLKVRHGPDVGIHAQFLNPLSFSAYLYQMCC